MSHLNKIKKDHYKNYSGFFIAIITPKKGHQITA